MNEFKKDDPFDCFTPVWNDILDNWNLRHSNGKVYSVIKIAMMFNEYRGKTLFLEYVANAAVEAFEPMFSGFFAVQWLRKIHDIVSVNYAESKRLEYLAANPSKGKQSEGIYTAALQEANNFYRNLK
jgi:hypothetical protein